MDMDEESIKLLEETMKTLVEDMRTLWALYPYGAIKIKIKLNLDGYGDSWSLIINDKKIEIREENNNNNTRLDKKIITKRKYSDGELEAHTQFIKQYDTIREKIVETIKKKIKEVEYNKEVFHDYRRKYEKEASIELDLPKSMNQHELQIEEKDGKKIGTIDFGGRTIRIITDGDIVLVKKESISKRKKK